MLKNPMVHARTAIALAIAGATAVSANAAPATRPGFHLAGGNQDILGLYQAGIFWIKDTPTATLRYVYFGNAGDAALPADFDGDGKTDLAIYRPDTRAFWWKRSSDGVIGASTFGDPDDIPIAADFDGDGKTDVAIYRPSTSQYWYKKSSDQSIGWTASVGTLNGQPRPGLIPFVGDFNGDGRSDAGAFDTVNSTFYWVTSSGSFSHALTSVSTASIPVIANFESTSFSNLAVYDTSAHKFVYVNQVGTQVSIALGAAGDTPLGADFDGDGKADFAVFSTASGSAVITYIASSTDTLAAPVSFGNSTDYALAQPLPLPYYQPAGIGAPSGLTGSSDAPQTMYQGGSPHVSTANVRRTGLAPDSFIPICLYSPYQGTFYGSYTYNGFAEAAEAGFNCIVTPAGVDGDGANNGALYQKAAAYGLRVIPAFSVMPGTGQADAMQAIVEHVKEHKLRPNIMAWKLDEEQSCHDSAIENPRWNNFVTLSTLIKAEDSVRPSIAVDSPYPVTASGCIAPWENWNTSAHIKIPSFDNYQFRPDVAVDSLGQQNAGHLGIPDSVAKVVKYGPDSSQPLNNEKPIWFTAQAFEKAGEAKMPTQKQMRAQVYAALTHGATGLMHFTYDSYASRQANVIGISKNAQEFYSDVNGNSNPATPSQILASRALWDATAALNSEITRFRSAWLSPTATRLYQVSIQSSPVPYVPTPIRTMLKRESNGLYTLFAVNLDNQAIKANFEFPGARLLNLRKVDPTGFYLPVPGINAFAENFEAFGVRIYQFTSAN